MFEKFNNLKLGVKIGITAGLLGVLALFVVLQSLYVLYKTEQGYEKLLEGAVKEKVFYFQLDKELLNVRRSIKDFMLYKNKQFADETSRSLNNMLGFVDEIARLEGTQEEAEKVTAMIQQLDTAFSGLRDRYLEKGLDHNSGLQGEFRKAAHEMETEFKNLDTVELYSLFLQGKVVANNRDTRTLKQFIGRFRSKLASTALSEVLKKELSGNVNRYERAFNAGNRRTALREMNRVERLLKEHLVEDAMADYLMLRRHEKDYLLRLDEKYVKRALGIIATIRKKVKDSDIKVTQKKLIDSKLNTYQNAFLQLVEKENEIVQFKKNVKSANKNLVQESSKAVKNSIEHEQEARIAMQENAQRGNVIAIVGAVVLIAGGVFVGLYVLRIVLLPVRNVLVFSEKFGSGDLTAECKVLNHDEFGEMQQALQNATGKVRAMLVDVKNTSDELLSNAETLRNDADQIASSSEETNSQTMTIAAASEEITANVNTVASATEESSANMKTISDSMKKLNDNFDTVAAASQEASSNMDEISNNVEKISGAVDKVVVSMEELSDALQGVSGNAGEAEQIARQATEASRVNIEAIDQLKVSADRIGQIVSLIGSIASQTNMLALNATIEAASAGEAGKGFSVVATEVKDLAQQTSRANDDIADQIGQIQENVNQSISNTKKVSDVIEKMTAINGVISQSIVRQDQNAVEIVSMVEEIAVSSRESAKGVSEGAVGLQEITQAASVASSLAEGVMKNTEESAQGVKEIAMSSAESANGLKEVNRNIQGIQASVNQVNKGVSSIHGSSEKLSSLSKALEELISFFRF
jgi:methyl-accepting chemotaxis protein